MFASLMPHIPALALISAVNAGMLELYEPNPAQTIKVYVIGFIMLCFLESFFGV